MEFLDFKIFLFRFLKSLWMIQTLSMGLYIKKSFQCKLACIANAFNDVQQVFPYMMDVTVYYDPCYLLFFAVN